jgi:hypothetical protein
MSPTIWNTIASTAWWVFLLYGALFIYLIKVGLAASQAQVISFKQLFTMPIISLIFSIICLLISIPITLSFFAYWISALGLGLLLGWLQFRLLRVKAVSGQRQFYLPGSWRLLLLFIVLIALKFYYAISFDLQWLLLLKTQYVRELFMLSGLATGMLIGRISYALRCLKIGPFIPKVSSSF